MHIPVTPASRSSNSSVVESIWAAVAAEGAAFADSLTTQSLDEAVDIWARRIAGRRLSRTQREELIGDVRSGAAGETREIELLRAALLRAAGWDERPAAARAVAAGATYSEVGEVLGITQQGASKRLHAYRAAETGEGR